MIGQLRQAPDGRPSAIDVRHLTGRTETAAVR
jgi:hypothetical protein